MSNSNDCKLVKFWWCTFFAIVGTFFAGATAWSLIVNIIDSNPWYEYGLTLLSGVTSVFWWIATIRMIADKSAWW